MQTYGTYEQSFEAAESAARAILAARPEVLGFDIEWQVSFVAGEVTTLPKSSRP